MNILTLNAGSSTLKASLFRIEKSGEAPSLLWNGIFDWGQEMPQSLLKTSVNHHENQQILEHKDFDKGTRALLDTLWSGPDAPLTSPQDIQLVGHRVVHGGESFLEPTWIDATVKEAIRHLIPLAPLHNPVSLAGIEAIEKILGRIPQIAVFDTAFHAHMPDYAATYAIPYHWRQEGIRRYGFHGISHSDCAIRAANMLQRNLDELKLITCHLGSGSSLAAVAHGKSIDTTMGFMPVEGLIMGTRCGSIDPGISLYLLEERHLSPDQLNHMLIYESGLKGICGYSDMRDVMAEKQKGNPRAILAFDMFIHSLVRNIGAMAAVLEGIDALIFTGGIGEHVPEVRAQACEKLNFLGITLDSQRNSDCHADQMISDPQSRIAVLVLANEEEKAIAQACWELNLSTNKISR